MTATAIIVSWDDAEATALAAASLAAQTVPLDEIVVIDNRPDHPALGSDAVRRVARVVASPENLGFAGGVGLGVRETAGDWIVLLNPDAVASPACVERLLAAASDRTGIVGAQLLLPDGRVNGGDNPVHMTGITWAGHYGEEAETGPPRPVASVSGAAMLIRRAALDAIGGINERYFLYHEDVELCWRMRLAGWDVVFQPAAHAAHGYEFDKGPRKWFLLERNRAWTVLTCYSGRALIVLAPLLLGTELAIIAAALRGGWWPEKRAALAALWRARRALRARRAQVQGTRRRGDAQMVGLMTPVIRTPFLPGRIPGPVAALLRAYRRLLLLVVR